MPEIDIKRTNLSQKPQCNNAVITAPIRAGVGDSQFVDEVDKEVEKEVE